MIFNYFLDLFPNLQLRLYSYNKFLRKVLHRNTYSTELYRINKYNNLNDYAYDIYNNIIYLDMSFKSKVYALKYFIDINNYIKYYNAELNLDEYDLYMFDEHFMDRYDTLNEKIDFINQTLDEIIEEIIEEIEYRNYLENEHF